jgi:GNAT superfamily N-acetyltransferase
MNIRPATPTDRSAILALVPRLSEVGAPPWRARPHMIAADTQEVSQGLEDQSGRSRFLVAEHGGTLLGFIYLMTLVDYYTGQEAGHVADIVVAPQAEGQGVGRALLAAGEEWARSRGYALLSLNVLAGNRGPRTMYEKLGYAPEWVKYVKPLAGPDAPPGP